MFFAIPEFTTSEGRYVNALFGMAKFFVGQLVKENPDYIVFIKDAKGENFRHKLYSDYKATRDRMPDNLKSQISDIEKMIWKMNFKIVEISWYEADDVIATLAVKLEAETNNEIFILSGDKDLYALCSEQVKIYDTQKKKISGPEETFEKFWVPPECIRDYLAICGDKSDNIPWITWIWPKKAVVLLNEFKTLDEIYIHVDKAVSGDLADTISPESQKILKGKTLEKFVNDRENAFLSQKLATLATTVDMQDFNIEDYTFSGNDVKNDQTIVFFKENEFYSLIDWEEKQVYTWEQLWKKVQIIWDKEWIIELDKRIFWWNCKEIVLDTETSSLDTLKAELIWVSILLNEDEIYYINCLHAWPQVNKYDLQSFIEKILNSELKIIWHNLKYDLQILENFLAQDFNDNRWNISEELWQTSLWI